ncbi:hypothetical protein A2303_02320 [Candidatus Falkowbacteria bacterium RIFOXYB2_FULL_47_14]|uniref:Uncharacterized protein n=1 Tax=Candidatus Falkowbacteria bacterium RIFOXYA2_FULL_47_19 TaxID=1797994 RepID=A0A1F5SET2_9BACT|nr:MAG: hypothetical protein A2227_07495 [Candidatus Falkowbacteria bacterium RIFOXYA2_FULL_47_19]OGF35256.1 MAG: hypothetical protein A2468_01130 [Candidatus Falkowbacteria bacterium RIFOXYC2_FULL_46_15]OGF43898.1 MAG: hypothetical protein A2303_02320 [Candidatus Falkowbacteria bacterium RIFOXYB2_FULL_47_14]
MNKYQYIIITIIGFTSAALFMANCGSASENLAQKLSGRILLQVEQHGEAWYISPKDRKRYFLSRPLDCFNMMRGAGTGITNTDLNKIPVGFIEEVCAAEMHCQISADADQDGIEDNLEIALGTDPNNTDTDGDGYSDKEEVKNGFNPFSTGPWAIEQSFTEQNKGKIFLQIEGVGEAWYVNPSDLKRYYLGRPADAFRVMRNLGLGISDRDLNTIAIGDKLGAPEPVIVPPPAPEFCSAKFSASAVMTDAAAAIRANSDRAAKCFTPEMKTAVEYTLDFLDADGRLTLGNILSKTTLTESADTEKTYSTEVYFSLGGYDVPLKFVVKKQDDNTWLLANL